MVAVLSSTSVQCGVVPIDFDQQAIVCSREKLYALSTVTLVRTQPRHVCECTRQRRMEGRVKDTSRSVFEGGSAKLADG